jgi:hypothetical protein
MGIAHSWSIDREFLTSRAFQEAMRTVLQDFRQLLPHLPPLAGPLGEGSPELSEEEVAFNGPAPRFAESFRFPGLLDGRPFTPMHKPWAHWAFCKTGQEPYALAVKAFLLLAKLHMGGRIALGSDEPLAAWVEAADLVEGVLHLPVDLPWTLGVSLHLVEDGKGTRFVLEGDQEDMALLAHRLERYTAMVGKPWPFVPPYRDLGRTHLPQHQLAQLHLGLGVYRLPLAERRIP